MVSGNLAMMIRIAADIENLKRDLAEGKVAIQSTATSMRSIGDSTNHATASTMNWKSALLGAANAFGIAFSVQAVVAFAGRVMDTASAIHDMSLKLGISAEATQGFKFAAEQAGSSLGAVGTALNRMNLELAQGDRSTIEALKAAGLRFEDIRAMKPEDAFLAITDAIAKIPDPMEQVRIGTALMGKGFSELLPAIKEGLRETADEVSKFSNETIKSLEQAQDAWSKLGNHVTIITGTMIAKYMDYVNLWKGAAGAFTGADAPKLPSAPAAGGSKPLGPLTLSDAEIAAISAGYDQVRAGLDKVGKSATTTAKSAKEFHLALSNDMIPVVRQLGVEVAVVAPKIDEWGKELEIVSGIPFGSKIGEQIAIIPPAVMEANRSFDILMSSIQGLLGLFGNFGHSVNGIINNLRTASEANKQFGGSAGIASGMFSASSSNAQKWASGVQSAGAVVGGAMSVWSATADSANKSQAALTGAMTGAKAGAAFGPWGLAVGAAAGAVVGLIHQLSAGRRAVKDFAASFGGFDDLRTKLLVLGDEGERLWIKLTQQTGKGDKAGAQKVIEEINKALEEHNRLQEDVITMTEEGAVATIETASQAQAALDELGISLTENVKEWEAWGASVRGVIDGLASGIRAMPLPTGGAPSGAAPMAAGGDFLVTRPTLFLAGEAGPERATFTPGGGRGGNQPITTVVKVVLDRRVLVEALAETVLT